MDEETILDFFCYDEALYPGLTCPSCDIGRLFCLDDAELYQCDICDLKFTVTDVE
jgi:hypothetical protein